MVSRTTEDSAPGAAFRPDVPAPVASGARRKAERSSSPISGSCGEALRDRVEVRSVAITGLFVLAVFYTLYFARAFFLPIVLAVLLDFLLSPIIRRSSAPVSPSRSAPRWSSWRCSAVWAAAAYSLAEPAREWVAEGAAEHATGSSRG